MFNCRIRVKIIIFVVVNVFEIVIIDSFVMFIVLIDVKSVFINVYFILGFVINGKLSNIIDIIIVNK